MATSSIAGIRTNNLVMSGGMPVVATTRRVLLGNSSGWLAGGVVPVQSDVFLWEGSDTYDVYVKNSSAVPLTFTFKQIYAPVFADGVLDLSLSGIRDFPTTLVVAAGAVGVLTVDKKCFGFYLSSSGTVNDTFEAYAWGF